MELSWYEDRTAPAPTSGDLEAVGVLHRVLPVDPDQYQGPLDDLKRERGYVTQDEVAMTPDMENLDELCNKFAQEHLHTDDEVRYVLQGEGIFDIRSADERWIRVKVEAGDLLVVPANCYHRFFLTDKKQIRCVRLFKDSSGWTPHYRQ